MEGESSIKEADQDDKTKNNPDADAMDEDHVDNNDDDDDDEGSVIDDWYDGHVIKVERIERNGDDDDENGTGGIESQYVFHVHFVGDETIYQISLIPSKVRPSARGWVQRTVALLRPPPAAGEDNDVIVDPTVWEAKLPPDTRTLDDEEHLVSMKAKIVGTASSSSSGTKKQKHSTSITESNNMLPSYDEYTRILTLRYLLEAQVYLRSKLSKIESPDGEERYTDGVRNPTEPYVNHLVQCCKDLILSCDWYCKAWKLLQHYFGDNDVVLSPNEEEQVNYKFNELTFEGLINEYLEFGKDTIINSTVVDVNSCSSAGKRRQPISPSKSTGRRNKRRKTGRNSTIHYDEDENTIDILSTASSLDSDIYSTELVDLFVKAIEQSTNSCWYAIAMGKTYQAISHLVVNPLVVWKGQAALILGNKEYANLSSKHIDKQKGRKSENVRRPRRE